MKKYLHLTISLITTFLLVACSTFSKDSDDDKLSFPTLKPCSKKLLNTNTSFICLRQQKETNLVETNIRFNSNSFTLDDRDKKVLDKLYAYVKLTGTSKLTIRGYTGKIDSKLIQDNDLLTEHDLRVSKNRAVSVRDYLYDKGLVNEEITIKALGYQDPIASNDLNSSRALNQRVEITVKSKLLEQIDNLDEHFHNIELEKYTKFFSNVFLLDENHEDNVAKIYASKEKRPILGINFKIFADKQYPSEDDQELFSIISKSESIASFNNDMKVLKIGTAKYDYTFKGITALTITDLSQEAKIGDFIIPNKLVSEPLPKKSFRMTSKITADIIENVKNSNNKFSAKYSSILLNKGVASGLKPGAEVILYEPESRADGFAVPPKYIGYGFVYRQSTNYSIVLIINSQQEITKNSMATTIL